MATVVFNIYLPWEPKSLFQVDIKCHDLGHPNVAILSISPSSNVPEARFSSTSFWTDDDGLLGTAVSGRRERADGTAASPRFLNICWHY